MNIKSRVKNPRLYAAWLIQIYDKGHQAIVLRSLLGIYSKEE